MTNLFAIRAQQVDFRTATNADWLDGLRYVVAGAATAYPGTGNVGSGTSTISAVSPGAKVGVWQVRISQVDAGGTTFVLIDPDAIPVAISLVGAPTTGGGLVLTVAQGGVPVLLREWLCSQLLPMSEQPARRAAMRARVAAALKDELTGDAVRDAARIDAAVEEQVQAVGRANVSRAISDLVRAGLMTRHYAGYATNHKNRGGGRHAVYVVKPGVLALLRKPQPLRRGGPEPANRQGDLFAA